MGKNEKFKKEVIFEFERETKNTYRFEEVTEGMPPAVRTLYVQKWVFGKKTPKKLKVTIEVIE